MYNKNALTGYRRLTIEEAEAAEKAIIWLASKRLKAENIALLTDRTLDRESKILYVKIETKHVIYYRKIRYQDSPLDTYLTGVQTIKGDSNLLSANIVAGKTIFNTQGSAQVPVISQDSTTKILSIS